MRETKDELQELETGLAQAKSLDEHIAKLVSENSAADLFNKAVYYMQWTGSLMALSGIHWIAYKDKVGHGAFKKTFLGKDRPFTYMHVWQCMKAAIVVSQHPIFGRLRTSRAFLKLMMLPAPEQKAIADEMKHVPEDQVFELLPGKIQQRYDEVKNAMPKTSRKKRASQFLKDNLKNHPDEAWNDVLDRWVDAVMANNALRAACEAVKEWKPEYVDDALEKKMVEQLGEPFDKVVGYLHPPEELRKRGMAED